MFKHLSAQELVEMQAQILDIRDPNSFAAGHITGATAVSNDNAAEVMSALNQAEPVVVCCYHGNSSQSAAAYLAEQGFDAYSLDGGFEQFKTLFPTHTSAS